MDQKSLHPGGLRLTRRALSLCEPITGLWVDIGCGQGQTARLLTDLYGVQAVGIDIDAHCVQKASESGGTFLLADAQKLPFGENSADGILLECCFCLMQDARAVLLECARVLKDGGVLCISDVYARNFGMEPSENFGHLYTEEDLHSMLKGFLPVHFEDCSGLLQEYYGQMLFEHGQGAPLDEKELTAVKKAGIGYYLLIARRSAR